ncbi:KdsC family phosphatase [Desulfovibrio litoralis]|uniref:3-deoxy-D-manno-octulosonate 8-phosphate phosphatase (KDO 8-P phosphatase) n=1 Tax=Desulfovibrio litoralis DSM 11393 TaxID=1121455 RepID=A0A1M7SF65_9BACT|nr:HAD-IIIA family hydrolase [Desulfovibrio litoralis]SHN57127.1 3-deoxy-D-manno-octulosonate 8-phosphate phosphatase (KDO 8-P phosphatase) [Desulfovibrio litoralis DSM 11393]
MSEKKYNREDFYPSYYHDPELIKLAKPITTLVFDIDGVFTDAGIYLDSNGEHSKRFNIQDGLGIMLAHEAGLKVAVITGQSSPAVDKRMNILKINNYYHGFIDKREPINDLKNKYNLSWNEIAYLGDDWVDLSCLASVGFPVAVNNAVPEVKEAAKLVTLASGGHGAVREFIQFILYTQNKLQTILNKFNQPA